MENPGKKTSPIKSPTNFKSRIPQKIEETNREIKVPTSPTSGTFQSKIPRSTSLKYSSSIKNETEVIVHRPLVKASPKENCDERLNVSLELQDSIIEKKLDSVNNGDISENTTNVGNEHPGFQAISNGTSDNYTEEHSKSLATGLHSSNKESEPQQPSYTSFYSWSSNDNDTNSINESDSENSTTRKYIIVQPVYHEIQHELLSNNALTSTPTTKSTEASLSTTIYPAETYSQPEHNTATMDSGVHTKTKSQDNSTTETQHDQNMQNGHTDFPDEDFERTEHDNNDYTTTTTTEYEKDGKVVQTTETVNYTNDRNIRTRVITTEKIVTIPYGQQLDLSNPEVTSSTTVRSKYLQTMLQNREYEGDKEVKAEMIETIETDVQTDKVDSNENSNDPDLDTILTIVETLDEVRSIEPKIKNFSGASAEDKTYTELLSILNTALSKFENIDPKGKESTEQKRQNGIEYIQLQMERLNAKLRENQPVTEPARKVEVEDSNKQQPEPQQPKVENTNISSQKPTPNVVEPQANVKNERKKSTLKKHFKFGNKDKKNDELQEEKKKKKKKMCVIS